LVDEIVMTVAATGHIFSLVLKQKDREQCPLPFTGEIVMVLFGCL